MLNLVPNCLRHGGPPTDTYGGTRSKQQVQDRGFWRSTDSVRRYQKHSRLTGQLAKLTDAQQAAAHIAVIVIPDRIIKDLRAAVEAAR